MASSSHRPAAAVAPAPGKLFPLAGGALVLALVVGGIYLGLRSGHGMTVRHAAGSATGSEQDALASSSGSRIVASTNTNKTAAEPGAAKKDSAAQHQQLVAQQEEATQQAALDAAKQELERRGAEQAAGERRLREEQARVEADKQTAAAALAEAERQKTAAAEAERLKQQQEAARQARVYRGPSSGEIVWHGEVRGTSLVTIEGNSSDAGQVVSGGLPGVLVMVQPVDGKHVGVAATPAPSNGFRRLVLRIQGNGSMQEVIHWSIP